jgi:hypothetical protein
MDKHMRAHGDILRICASIRKSKHLIANLESTLGTLPQRLNDARELYTEGLWSLRGDGIKSFALEEIHPVETEGFDFDESL